MFEGTVGDERGKKASEHALKVTYLTKECASGSDTKAGPWTPDKITYDDRDFMTKELLAKNERAMRGRHGNGPGGKRRKR